MNQEKSSKLAESIELAINELCQSTDKAKQSDIMQNYLNCMSKFHNYSFGNCLLINWQFPSATQVAGYNDWKVKFNRQVKKGEKSIKILAPIKKVIEHYVIDDKGYFMTDESGQRITQKTNKTIGFKQVSVFDISQTKGDDLPIQPDWYDDKKYPILQDAIFQVIKSHNIEIEITKNLNGARGISMGGKIMVLDESSTKTLIHELSHELLHKKSFNSDKAIKELEAESVAYIVLSYFGIKSQNTPNYLVLWNADKNKIMTRFNTIANTSKMIINEIEGVLSQNGVNND